MPVHAATADLDTLLSQMQRHVDALHSPPSAHRARYAAVELEPGSSERTAVTGEVKRSSLRLYAKKEE